MGRPGLVVRGRGFGLVFNDNSADRKETAGERVGDPGVVDRNPLSAYDSVGSNAITGTAGCGSTLALTKAPGSNVIRVGGSYPLGKEAWENSVAMEDPARYATAVFVEVLEARGIRVTGGLATSSDPLPQGLRVLAAHDSPPMGEMIKAVNKPSQNLHAEMLLRLLGTRVKGAGTWAGASRDRLPEAGGREAGSWALQDGSVSRSDLLSPTRW